MGKGEAKTKADDAIVCAAVVPSRIRHNRKTRETGLHVVGTSHAKG